MADSPNNKEVLRWELDITDVEAKSRRMQEALSNAAKAAASGQDPKPHVEALNQEVETLEKSRGKTVEAQDAIEKLSRSKRDLADVVSLLGGRFGGLIGDVEGLVALLSSGGLLAGVGLGIAGFTALIGVLATVKEKTEAAQRAHLEYISALRTLQTGQIGERESIAREAAAAGVAGAGSDVLATQARLAKGGVPADFARNAGIAAQLAASAGIEFDEQAYLRGLVMNGGDASTFNGTRGENLFRIRRTLAAGQSPGAEAAYSGFIRDVAPNVQATQGVEGVVSDRDQAINAEIARLKKFGIYDERKLSLIEEYLRDPEKRKQVLESETVHDWDIARLFGMRGYRSAEESSAAQIAEQEERFGEVGRAQSRGGKPVVYNVTQHINAPGTQYNGAGSPWYRPNYTPYEMQPANGQGQRSQP